MGTARLVHNRKAGTDIPQTNQILTAEACTDAHAEIKRWPGYAPTPLRQVPDLAERVGVAEVLYKDESLRFGQLSFKSLGGSYAVARLLAKSVAERLGHPIPIDELASGKYASITGEIIVACASAGNHGRSVAFGARMFGCQCVIFLHAAVSEGREHGIRELGARVIRTAGDYDESVAEAAETSAREGWTIISDTSAGGDDSVVAHVMQGYTLSAREVVEQLRANGSPLPTHVLLQAGVGGFAAAICGYLQDALDEAGRPRFVIVEPESADCLLRSAEAGKPTLASGDLATIMVPLACREVSSAAWGILQTGANDFISVADDDVMDAMRMLARRPEPIVAGPAGAAGVGALLQIAREGTANALGLGPNSRVLVFGTEGATDPELYAEIVHKIPAGSR